MISYEAFIPFLIMVLIGMILFLTGVFFGFYQFKNMIRKELRTWSNNELDFLIKRIEISRKEKEAKGVIK